MVCCRRLVMAMSQICWGCAFQWPHHVHVCVPQDFQKGQRVVSLVCKTWRDMWHWKWWILSRESAWIGKPVQVLDLLGHHSQIMVDILDSGCMMMMKVSSEISGSPATRWSEIDVFWVFWMDYCMIVLGVLVVIRDLIFWLSTLRICN